MHITFISSFVPRKCGIATYTRDLTEEVKRQKNEVAVIALEHSSFPSLYTAPVTDTIRQHEEADYKKIAGTLNESSTDCVHIQHEFGLFGGPDGDYILSLAELLTKPLTVTFHTVLLTPTEHQTYVMQVLARLSRRVTVMDEIAKDRLVNIYGLNAKDITVIFHGAPTVKIKQKKAKQQLHLAGSFVLLANNLLSRNKGIEYAIEAVGKVKENIPNIKFLIVGETHPVVKLGEGESYREELTQLVQTLHLEDQVVFNNTYIDLEELKLLLAAADVYITPYLDPQQITSGTLSYAIGADKACIATEYVYAKEMLAGGRGMLVPFRDSDAIATALITLATTPDIRQELEKKVNTLGKGMKWSNVAEKHTKLYKKIHAEEEDITQIAQQFISSPIDISYLMHLTDTVGIMQHAYHTIPDRKFGYSTDDNARALIVVSQLYKQGNEERITDLIKVYISYLQFAQEKGGKFHTFLNFHRNWDDQAEITDAYGKTMWALGLFTYNHSDSYFAQPMNTLFANSLGHIDTISDIRNAAYTILGLYYHILAYDSKTDTALRAAGYMKKLADFLVKCYEQNNTDTWHWFEHKITYDNFRLPQALFAAYLATKDNRYKQIATETLAFITDCNFDSKQQYFDFIGQNGWYTKGSKKEAYDQQPLEAAGAVDAYLFAANVLKNKHHAQKAMVAFEWFFGKNRNHRPLYDYETKGVHDGLNLRGVNQNEGAESLVCFLMACLSLKDFFKEDLAPLVFRPLLGK